MSWAWGRELEGVATQCLFAPVPDHPARYKTLGPAIVFANSNCRSSGKGVKEKAAIG